VDYVTKPFNDLELTARISNHLELKRRSDMLRTELNFSELHEAFRQRLFKKYDNLTAKEVRLCTYLRLNMSTKEISEITNQGVHALEAARSRLRKKLKLGSSVNLVNFLQQL
jgi:DNA-binding response OmpR family regulator